MNCTEVQSALSDVLDGTLHRDKRAQVEAHLESCADCRAVLADLRRIREQARALPKMAPPDALWEKVRAGFEAETGNLGKQGRLPHGAGLRHKASGLLHLAGKHGGLPHGEGKHGGLPHGEGKHGGLPHRNILAGLAAAAALVLATSTGIYFVTRPAPMAPAPQVAAAPAHAKPAESVQSIESELQLAVQHYENAITGLETVAKDGQSVLSPETTAVLAKSNAILDQAVSESQAALRTQPTSEIARASLFEALQRKVALLRDTVSLINEMRKGDPAGAARAAGQLGKS